LSRGLVAAGPRLAALRVVLVIAALGAALAPSAVAQAEGPPCPNEQLRQESNIDPATGQPYSAQLPDCRAYELVSPPETGGYPAPATPAVTAAGVREQVLPNGSIYFASQTAPAVTGAAEHGGYLDIFRSRRASSGWETRDLTPGLGGGPRFLEAVAASGSAILIDTTLALNREDADNPLGNPTQGPDLYILREGGEPPVFVSHGELTNTKELEHSPLTFPNSELTAVGFLSDVPLSHSDPSNGSEECYVWRDSGTQLAQLTNPAAQEHGANCHFYAMAADGQPIVEDISGDADSGLIFATGDPTLFPSGAYQLSGETPGAATVDGLSPDGRTVYLTTTDKLDNAATTDSGADLYAIDLSLLTPGHHAPQEAAVTCVSCDADGDPSKPNEGSATYVGQSTDGSHVFFTLGGALYAYDPMGTTQKVAAAADHLEDTTVSQNGQYVLAQTSAALSGSDSDGARDLYEFTETDGFAPQLITDGASVDDVYTPVAVSDDGQRVLYDEKASQAPGVIDEWSAAKTSQLSPIGATAEYRVMGTAGSDLEDVFLEAHEPLVAQDRNADTTDIYDARIDGGFPAPTEPTHTSQTPNPSPPVATPYGGNLVPPSLGMPSLAPDTSAPSTPAKPKALTKDQELFKALKACKQDRSKTKRETCERNARKKYAATKKTAKK